MDKPSTQQASNLLDLCPACQTNVRPVVTTQAAHALTAAYRCHICRHDWLTEWQMGYVKREPALDVNLARQPIDSPTIQNVGNVCQTCGAPPGAPHAIACPHP